MSSRTLITGGLGLIGARLAQRLLALGENVLLGTRNPVQSIPKVISGCQLVEMDFKSQDSLQNACAGVRQVVHLAAMNDAQCSSDPEAAFEMNVLGTLRLTKAAAKTGVERLIYASTAHVYRSPLSGTFDEQTIPHPSSIYALTHRAAEDVVMAVGTDSIGIVLRFANGFGAPIHPQTNCWTLLVNDLCRQAATHGKLTLRSSGSQPRNFVTLSDVSRSLQHFLELPSSDFAHKTFNIGGKTSMTVLEMTTLIAERCEKILGFRPPIHRTEGGVASAPLHFSIDRAKRTGFTPFDDYASEIDACLIFCREHFSKT